MPTTLLARFLNRFTSDEDNKNDGRFVPSQLDWSVRYGTEGGREEANREIRGFSGRPTRSNSVDASSQLALLVQRS